MKTNAIHSPLELRHVTVGDSNRLMLTVKTDSGYKLFIVQGDSALAESLRSVREVVFRNVRQAKGHEFITVNGMPFIVDYFADNIEFQPVL